MTDADEQLQERQLRRSSRLKGQAAAGGRGGEIDSGRWADSCRASQEKSPSHRRNLPLLSSTPLPNAPFPSHNVLDVQSPIRGNACEEGAGKWREEQYTCWLTTSRW